MGNEDKPEPLSDEDWAAREKNDRIMAIINECTLVELCDMVFEKANRTQQRVTITIRPPKREKKHSFKKAKRGIA